MTAALEGEQAYLARVEQDQVQRLAWFREARFGMFIHWGLYSQLGRDAWALNTERIPAAEYEKLAITWRVKPGFARQWARLAKAAGMKYMVFTTKHHDGFCLWNTKQTDYNAVQRGPKRDLVQEYVEAARGEGLRVGFYYSLMDWHHPDGIRCKADEAARRRFVDFTHGCVRELLSHYGKIDILWYDVSWPLPTAQAWESVRMNAMARDLQPHILINDRSTIPEDFGTPEEHIKPATGGRAWEACLTFNGAWGWQPTPPEDWHSARKVIDMLRTCTAGGGNLLLNIGPHPDGAVPALAVERLTTVGQWLQTYGGTVYGKVDPIGGVISSCGNWSRKGRKVYFWCSRWPGTELALAAVHGKLLDARVYPHGDPLPVEQTDNRLLIKGLPAQCPDRLADVAMLELEFAAPPRQYFSAGPVLPDIMPADLSGPNFSPPVLGWRVSDLLPRPADGVAAATPVQPQATRWRSVRTGDDGFASIHDALGDADGLVYFAVHLDVPRDGQWRLHLGHDGGVKLFFDGQAVLCEPKLFNPSMPGRSSADVPLAVGRHDVQVAFDTCAGRGWGIFLHFEALGDAAAREGTPAVFPKPCE